MKKSKKKYQIGGTSKMTDAEAEKLRQQLAEWDAANGIDNSTHERSFDPFAGSKFSEQVQNEGLQDFSYSRLEGTGERDFSNGFKALNGAALITTGIANRLTDIRNDKKNQRQLIQSLQKPASVNYNEDGDNSFAYYKAGGFKLNPAHKGFCTPMSKPTCTGKRRQFALNAKNHFKKKQTGGITAQTMADWNNFVKYARDKGYATNPDLNVRDKNLGKQYLDEYIANNPSTTLSYDLVTPIQQSLQDYRARTLANIQAGKGQFAPGTTSDNFMGGISKVDGWLGTKTLYPFGEEYVKNYQNGQLKDTTRKGFAPLAKLQTGGEGDAELEAGEVYKDDEGMTNKIPDTAPTHEEDGVNVSNVAQVLEDTSDKRKDKASKALKLQPTTVKALLDFKPKTSLTHAKAYEKAIEFNNKKANRITNKLVKNAESRQDNDNDTYALNSMKFNMNTLKTLPSEGELFNTVFQHQEAVKAAFGIQDNGKMKQTGGYTFKPYAGDKNFKGNASKYTKAEWDAMAQDLGFEGGDTKEFQQFLINQQGDVGQAANLQPIIEAGHKMYGNPLNPLPKSSVNNWLDGRLGHRWDAAYEAWLGNRSTPRTTGVPIETQAPVGVNAPISPLQPNLAPIAPGAVSKTTPVSNRFNSPLKWYDVAGELSGLATDTAAPVLYNPAELHKIRLRQQNPLPTLQQGQADFNAAVSGIANSGVNGGAQMGNIANLYAKKYALNDQVLGNYENLNTGIKNQETQYNAQIDDRQSLEDQRARGVFDEQVKGTNEAVRQQKRTDWDALFNKIAQNSKFNKEGNLLMHLFPAFTQTGDYDGYQRKYHLPAGTGADVNARLVALGVDPSKLNEKDKASTLNRLERLAIKQRQTQSQ